MPGKMPGKTLGVNLQPSNLVLCCTELIDIFIAVNERILNFFSIVFHKKIIHYYQNLILSN